MVGNQQQAQSRYVTDSIAKTRRSNNMAAIRSTDTKPELIVRRLAHALGYGFRLHRKDLPGKPDLVFASRRKIIFVHGCFWHLHSKTDCLDARKPKSNTSYWHPKLERNVARDAENRAMLASMAWDVLVIWDCETGDLQNLSYRLREFLKA